LHSVLDLFEFDFALQGTADSLSQLIAHQLARHLDVGVRNVKLFRKKRQPWRAGPFHAGAC